MALKLNTVTQLDNGLTVPSMYVRVTSIDGPTGDRLFVNFNFYSSAEAFEQQKPEINGVNFKSQIDVNYDRTKDGVDTLAFAHQEAVKYFDSIGVDAVILLDSLI